MSLGWSNLEECFTSPLTYEGKGSSPVTNWTDVDKTRIGASAMSQTQQVQQQAPTTLPHQLPSGLHQEHSLPSSTNLPFNDTPDMETYQREIVLGEISHPKPTPPEIQPQQQIQIEKPTITLTTPPDPIRFDQFPTKVSTTTVSPPTQEYTTLNKHMDSLKARLVTVENIVKNHPYHKEHENYWMVILLVFVASFLLMACQKK